MFELAILKLTAFCNLDCKYCYMFNLEDKTFSRVGRQMPLPTSLTALDRVCEHVEVHGAKRFHVTLHGGEPTLWPEPSFRAFFDRVEAIRDQGLDLSLSMQTNGYRINPRLLRLFSDHQVTIGVSIDGPREYNDAARVNHSGAGTYERVMSTVTSILEGDQGDVLRGFLSVADPRIPPSTYLDWADSLPIRRLDVLWPMDFNHMNPPWPEGGETAYAQTPLYGTWFAELFEDWWRRDDPTLYIRFFYDCLSHYLGSTEHIENIVNDTVPIAVVNTDGQFEYHDYFRGAFDGATRSPFNVITHGFDDLLNDATFNYLLHLHQFLPTECSACPVRSICGGGFLPGRVDATGLPPHRRSVLCHDQLFFFERFHDFIAPWLDRAGATIHNSDYTPVC